MVDVNYDPWRVVPRRRYEIGYLPYDLSVRIGLALYNAGGAHGPFQIGCWNRLTDEQHANTLDNIRKRVRRWLNGDYVYELRKKERALFEHWLSLGDLVTLRLRDCPSWAESPFLVRHDIDDDVDLKCDHR